MRSQDPCEVLLAACLQRPPAEHDTALDEACQEHPELSSDLRRRAEFLREIRAFGVTQLEALGGLPEFEDFELLDCLGTGGMGVVYRARQRSLGREVAIKWIRPEFLHSALIRERFRRECETVARLRHPGIVPVHAAAEEHGIPYLVMELIDGETLESALRRLRTSDLRGLTSKDLQEDLDSESWERACVRVILQVADALEHAHRRGVLHRDLKPSNIAIGKGGSARLLDFGLVGSPAVEGQERLTKLGSPIGTVPYMAPELLSGQVHHSVSSDLYALGVTLYEILTLSMPFRSPSEGALIKQIEAGLHVPLRDLNPRISHDVQAIVQKAMDIDPGRRYETAEALAEDLRSVLLFQPVSARPPGLWLRARRLVQRRPALVSSTVLGALLLVGTPTALYVQQAQNTRVLEASLKREVRLKEAAEHLRERADRHVERTRTAMLDPLMEIFKGAHPDQATGPSISIREVLRRGALVATREEQRDPLLSCVIRTSLAELHLAHGSFDKAIDELELGFRLYDDLAEEEPRVHHGLLLCMARALRRSGELASAEEYFSRAEEKARLSFGDTSKQHLVALVEIGQAKLQAASTRTEGVAMIRRALASAETSPDAQRLVAPFKSALGGALILTNRHADALPLLRSAHAVFESRGAELSQEGLATRHSLGLALSATGHIDEASEILTSVFEDLLRVVPGNHQTLATSCYALGDLELRRKDFNRARACFRRGLDFAGEAEVDRTRGAGHQKLAAVEYELRNWEAAIPHLEAHLETWKTMRRYPPGVFHSSLRRLAECLIRTGRLEESRAPADRLLTLLAGEDPKRAKDLKNKLRSCCAEAGFPEEAKRYL